MTDRPAFDCCACPDREVCQAPCDWMERQLPTMPPTYLEKTYGLWPSTTLGRVRVPPSNGRVTQFGRRLTNREWEVVRLVYREGMTQSEVSRKLSLSRSTVRNCVDRIRRKLAKSGAKNCL